MMEALLFILGAVFGSFLNVCIHRMPKDESIIRPGSHCPACQKPIAWRDNIPLFGYLFLRGRCRRCGAVISFRYFAVELVSAALWVVLWSFYGPSPEFLAGLVFFSILLAVTMTDFETGYIPDKLSLPGIGAALVLGAAFPSLHHEVYWYRGLLQATVGAVGGGAFILIAGWLGSLAFRKEAMGGGDVKLLAMIGGFIGFQQSVFVFFLAPVFALPFALYMKFARKAETIPYGPFLALAGAVFYVCGDTLVYYFWNYSS